MEKIQTADEISALVRKMYGPDYSPVQGVVHVTAVWKSGDEYITMNILPETPQSSHDKFALSLVRAETDAIITSGRILGEEKDMTHAPFGEAAEGLARYRLETLGKTEQPYSLILTRGKDFIRYLGHPLFNSGTKSIIYTSDAAPEELKEEAEKRGIEFVRDPNPSIRNAIAYLQKQRGAKAVSIEAGPSTSKQLYGEQPAVEELRLSVFQGQSIDDAVKGGPFVLPSEVTKIFGSPKSSFQTKEGSGPWEFYRYARH